MTGWRDTITFIMNTLKTGKYMLFWGFKLGHKKNKGMQQSHTSSQNSETIDVWKVVCHPPIRCVMACDDYSFKSTMVFFLLL